MVQAVQWRAWRAHLRSVLLEDEKTHKARGLLWKNEADEDVRLMRKYASRLGAQGAARAKASEDKICTSASNEAHKTKEAERERGRKVDENFAATPRSARTARTRAGWPGWRSAPTTAWPSRRR